MYSLLLKVQLTTPTEQYLVYKDGKDNALIIFFPFNRELKVKTVALITEFSKYKKQKMEFLSMIANETMRNFKT